MMLLENPQPFGDLFPEIKVVFLRPNTTSLFQPMEQTVIATFKCYYTCHIMTQAIAVADSGIVPTLRQFWKNYNIWNAINNNADSWAVIKQSMINKCWRNICPEFVSDDQDNEETPEQMTKEVAELGRQLNLEMKDADVDELTASHSDELMSNKDRLKLPTIYCTISRQRNR
jgi:hypothetical protein